MNSNRRAPMQPNHPLKEAAQRAGVDQERIVRFIEFEWITPADPANTRLDAEDIARVRLIEELQERWGVNNEAIPLLLHLIDQLNRIQIELKRHRS